MTLVLLSLPTPFRLSPALASHRMEKLCKLHIAKIILTALLLLIIPILSSSMRPPYIYLIVNLLILALGAESGLLTAFRRRNAATDERKLAMTSQLSTTDQVLSSEKKGAGGMLQPADGRESFAIKKLQETDQKKDGPAAAKVHKVIVKKCPSTPSLFYIGGSGCDVEEEDEDDEEEETVDALTGAELFAKAEAFIGNFHKQLKMQREESWKKIHGLFT